ncbi:MAG: hypothetical protein QXD89_01100 [Candidatus Aenigmatarchaeota archaeon]
MKGLESRIVVFIVAVIVFITLSYFIIKIAGTTLSEILSYLGIVKTSNVEKAILCAVYRCTEGCLSMKVQEISWREGDKTIYCNDFCKEGYDPSDKYARICGRDFPVIVKLDSSEKIAKEHLKLGGNFYKDVGCIISANTELDIISIIKSILIGELSYNLLEDAWKSLIGETIGNTILYIDKSLIKSYGVKEDCVDDATGFVLTHDSLKEVEIKSKVKINISVDKFEFFNFKSLYILLSPGDL